MYDSLSLRKISYVSAGSEPNSILAEYVLASGDVLDHHLSNIVFAVSADIHGSNPRGYWRSDKIGMN